MPRAVNSDYSANKPWLTTSRANANIIDQTTTGEVRAGDYHGGDWYETLNDEGKYVQVDKTVDIGDPDANDSGVNLHIDVPNNLIAFTGHLGTNQCEEASTLGAVIRAIDIYDADGVKVGCIPVYDEIT